MVGRTSLTNIYRMCCSVFKAGLIIVMEENGVERPAMWSRSLEVDYIGEEGVSQVLKHVISTWHLPTVVHSHWSYRINQCDLSHWVRTRSVIIFWLRM